MAVLSAAHKKKRSVLMKAKSVGNSPAITPPATPPSLRKRPNIHIKAPAMRQQSLPVKSQSNPVQFAIVLPSTTVTTRQTVSSIMPSTTLSSQLIPQSTALAVKPKALLQNTQATLRPLHTASIIQVKGAMHLKPASPSQIFIRPSPQESAANFQSMPIPATVSSTIPSVSLSSVPCQNKSTVLSKGIIISSPGSSIFPSHEGNLKKAPVSLLNMPVIDSCDNKISKPIPTTHLVPKTKPSTSINDSVTPKVKAFAPTNSSLPSKTKSSTFAIVPISTESKPLTQTNSAISSIIATTSSKTSQMVENVPPITKGSALLQTMLVSNTTSLLNSKLSSTSLMNQHNIPRTHSSDKSEPQSECSVNKTGVEGPSIKVMDGQRPDEPVNTSLPSSTVSSPQSSCTTVDEHAYCSSPTSNHNSINIIKGTNNNSASKVDSSSSSIEAESSNSMYVSISLENCERSIEELENPTESAASESKSVPDTEFVFEDGEIFVDDDGNDILDSHISPSSKIESTCAEELLFTKAVSFGKSRGSNSGRRGRTYRRQAEYSSSPIKEDTNNFFDKIPSHYTVLSIPSKPMKTTAFESTTKAVGSVDHLELSNAPVVTTEEGHYDKVPAYRSIFTNTAKDLNVPLEETDYPEQTQESQVRLRRHSSSSQHSHRSTSSHRSHRSDSRNSPDGRFMYSVSRSPDSRRGRSPIRSERRRRSSSQLSTSSSMSDSSGSYCSTCGGSLSRSRSRSCSSERSYEHSGSPRSQYSRSRSRSPQQERDRQMRRRRRFRSYTPDERGFKSRSRSRSRSGSPARQQRATRLSRSERHRTKSRSSAERQIMEKRKRHEEENNRAMEERRVVYVGRIPDGYTRLQLRKRFEQFGEIKAVKLHFREHGDNYGFVTFAYSCDAIAAKEKGNSIPGEKRFDLCFGGRRQFCPDDYADLDGNREIEEEYAPMPKKLTEELDYTALLKEHLNQQKKKR